MESETRKIVLSEVDCKIYTQEIRPYLPDRIVDAHVHMYLDEYHGGKGPGLGDDDPCLRHVDMAMMERWWEALFEGVEVSGLVLGYPSVGCDMAGENTYMAEHVGGSNRFSMLVHPTMGAGELEKDILRLKPFGLKPYLVFAQVPDVQEARIEDLIPEAQIALADKYGLSVTLHVSKRRGMGDAENLADIARLVKAYPKCQFILAHCGRCFIAVNMEEALKGLPVAENLWIDTSAVCDTGVFLHLFSKYDQSRLLFGTDLVTASGFRGSYVGMGMSWDACTDAMMSRQGGQKLAATFCAYENLRSMLLAARFCGVSQERLDGIFYGNAASLMGL